ncbi:MAG TPA: mannose-1-phosphate guanylyltransferase [Candidatus Brocadiia bacterium]|nr:mannose-1-phosphate guanylyltransferase [Candidatus Brocadiia bacterium]
MRFAVIMAGGAGERFWPLSRQDRPKQLLRLADPNQTLLEQAVRRVAPLIPAERVFVVTGRALREPIRKAGLPLPPENVVAEPCKRNTAGCLVYAAAWALARLGGEADGLTMAVLTADHRIGGDERFARTVGAALEAAEREEALVTIGVRPSRPETGYGYIEAEGEGAVRPVKRFLEKPDAERAREFAASGRHFWNSGMFFWRVGVFLRELGRARPAHAEAARRMAEALKRGDEAGAAAIFERLEDISIDYALMEKARRVLMARADFEWDDVGAWDALERAMPLDKAGNAAVGGPALVDCRGCVVCNAAGPEKMAVAALGVEGLVVVVCEDAVLVAPKARAQEVKKVVALLKERGARQV